MLSCILATMPLRPSITSIGWGLAVVRDKSLIQ
jgi:hypothetical protein